MSGFGRRCSRDWLAKLPPPERRLSNNRHSLMLENNMRIIVLTIVLLSCASPTFSQTAAPEPIKPPTTQDKYQDAYRQRINKINERIQRKQIEAACKAE